MKDRLKSLKRLLHLQERLKDRATWRLGTLDKHRSELETTQAEMVTALDRTFLAHGPFLASMTRSLHVIDREITKVKADIKAQSKQVISQTARAKVAEKLFEKADIEQRMTSERKNLDSLIERLISTKRSSST